MLFKITLKGVSDWYKEEVVRSRGRKDHEVPKVVLDYIALTVGGSAYWEEVEVSEFEPKTIAMRWTVGKETLIGKYEVHKGMLRKA